MGSIDEGPFQTNKVLMPYIPRTTGYVRPEERIMPKT
jgi:hypothetical protein